MHTRQLLITSAFALFFAASALAADETVSASEPWKWGPELQLETDIGVGHNSRDIGLPQMMIPVWENDNSMLFTDLRYRFDDEQSQEYNLGLGYRREVNSNWILGGYGFFDKLSSADGNLYSQGTFGLEALSVNNDARINVYVPQSTVHGTPGSGTMEIVGNQIGVAGGAERALPGEDFELGQKLPLDFADVRVYGGGYRYTADNFGMVAGPRGRLEVTLNDRYIPAIPFGAEVSLGGEIEHDQERGTEQFVLLKLRIPFGGTVHKSTDTLDQRMNTFIERDVDIVEKTGSGGLQPVELNGATVTNVVALSTGGNFSNTVNTASAGSLILANGNINYGTNTATTMKAGQTIAGGGATLTFTTPAGTSVNYTTPGSTTTVGAGGSSSAINMANNTSIQNVTFTSLNSSIQATSNSQVVLKNINVTSAGDAIFITNSSNVTMSNLTVNAAFDGMDIGGSTGITVTNSNIAGTAGDGIFLNSSGGNHNVALSNLTLSSGLNDIGANNSTVDGLSINNVQMTGANGVTFSNTTGTGLSGTGNTVTVSGAACSSGGASITGSMTYNTSSHCP